MEEPYTSARIFRPRSSVWLIVIAMLSVACLVLAHYFSFKVSNSIRAYINGESIYSKGEKSAALNLILFVETGEAVYYESFQRYVAIPIGDKNALEAMQNKASQEEINKHFREGGIHPDDIDNLTWLYRTFRNFEFMEKATAIWESANSDILALENLGKEIRERYNEQGSALDKELIRKYTGQIHLISTEIKQKEDRFSDVLGSTAREMSIYLFWINVLLIAVIFACLGLFYRRVIHSFHAFHGELQAKNRGLEETNNKLDKMVYAASHEMKAPLDNIEGLLDIFKMDPAGINDFQSGVIHKISHSLTSLKSTIVDIENLNRLENHPFDDLRWVNLNMLIDNIVTRAEKLNDAEIKRDLKVEEFYFSQRGVYSILFNLIFNALKFRSPKRKPVIEITTEKTDNGLLLSVSDNGLGINLEQHGNNLFDMFKRFHNHATGSGLGLYAVKRIVDRNGGEIQVESEVGVGTTFFVKLNSEKRIKDT